jgi:hypothetical protein
MKHWLAGSLVIVPIWLALPVPDPPFYTNLTECNKVHLLTVYFSNLYIIIIVYPTIFLFCKWFVFKAFTQNGSYSLAVSLASI